jgi:hypothetical protein
MTTSESGVRDNDRPMNSLLSGMADRCFLAFFLLLPFTYALQVVLGAPEVAAATYLFLSVAMAALLAYAYRNRELGVFRGSWRQILPLCVVFVLVHQVSSCLLAIAAGDAQLGLRGLLLFSLPLLLFWAVQIKRQEGLAFLLPVIAVGGVFVCFEMLYETFSLRILETPTGFQLLNREYVISRIGQDLTQLWRTGYRPPGLLEHVHAVTFFAALAALAHAVLFCRDGHWYWLAGLALCSGALLAHGVRIPVIAAGLAFSVLAMMVANTETDSALRRRGLIVIATLGGLVLLVLFADPFGTARAYYWPAIFRGDFQVSGRSTSEMIAQESSQLAAASELGKFLLGQDANVTVLLIGHGIVGSLRGEAGFNDDLFLFALLAQYGVFGFLVFLTLWCLATYVAIAGLIRRRELDSQARSLLYFAAGALMVLGLSLLHSSVLQRKAIYPFFPIAAGIAWRYRARPGTCSTEDEITCRCERPNG